MFQLSRLPFFSFAIRLPRNLWGSSKSAAKKNGKWLLLLRGRMWRRVKEHELQLRRVYLPELVHKFTRELPFACIFFRVILLSLNQPAWGLSEWLLFYRRIYFSCAAFTNEFFYNFSISTGGFAPLSSEPEKTFLRLSDSRIDYMRRREDGGEVQLWLARFDVLLMGETNTVDW